MDPDALFRITVLADGTLIVEGRSETGGPDRLPGALRIIADALEAGAVALDRVEEIEIDEIIEIQIPFHPN